MAQTWRERRAPPPLDGDRLEQLALRYVGRYATTRAKLSVYLTRKVRERGWGGERDPDIAGLVEKLADLRYIDDAGFAAARTSALMRRGYGLLRVSASLKAAGVEAAPCDEQAQWDAAIAFAQRKRIGPFADCVPDRAGQEKAFGAMMRAGHGAAVARRIVRAAPGQVPTWDEG